ncbi:hypothetical protein DPMN_061533 [Dreissena polymorpha]|uniref:Uncharacterized protein n=1 Tax=Dreissena polymorpha TaxID=45954 RepID=A0A9D4HH90_DREPO|nr:hypothetical protein DPMN_061533 [Dreissena polymorpha]
MRAGWLVGWLAGGRAEQALYVYASLRQRFSVVMEWLDVSFEEEVVTTTQHDPKPTVTMMTAGKFTSCYNAVKVQSHYDAGGALCVIRHLLG